MLTNSKDPVTKTSPSIPDQIQEVLDDFQDVFAEPSSSNNSGSFHTSD